ncbi:response regulator transcription factor [Salinispirillum sp. LH 10-3-1]|uniref:Response regulator transcription factor n=1 Tax=Salinispirillum sp. LH 10-3-1 TaxID=2952525 RepID=A0AB38YEY1_9GAMM
MKILVIEDDQQLNEFVCHGLQQAGYVVDSCGNGKEGLMLAVSETHDLIIVDRMLPEVDGLTIVRTLRASNLTTPVLILSALGEVEQRVEGLRAGSDDYLAKPFAFEELQARVEALLRRGQQSAEPITAIELGDLRLDLRTRQAFRAGQKIHLQQREFRLLEYLMRHAGQVVTRTMLLENVWDYHFDPQTNVIDVHISRLRQKIDLGQGTSLIQTVRGAGYVFQTV